MAAELSRQIRAPGTRAVRAKLRKPTTCALGGLLTKKRKTSQQSLEPALESWLRDLGLPEQKVEIAQFRQQGRGLLAHSRIQNGERLLKIPERALLTPDSALAHSTIGPEMERAQLPAWSVLAATLTEARFSSSPSEWRAYAQALPQTTGCVLEWGDDEVELLSGSGLHSAALEITEAATQSLEELEEVVAKAERDGRLSQGLLSRKRLRWAFAMLLSRLVRLSSWHNTEALCPWADMLNHDCAATTHLDYDPSSRTAFLTSDRSYQSGDQVYASYGTKTSGQLLLSYGFAPPAAENPHDGCLLRLELSAGDRLYEAKSAALGKFGVKPSQEFPVRMGALPQGIIQFAAYKDAEPADAAEAAELADWLFGKGQFPRLDGVDTELLGIEVLRDDIRTALAAFPGSIEESREQARALAAFRGERDSSVASPQARKALITEVKLQEQRVLHRALFVLQQRRKELET